jgi:hypothetical protein
LSDLIDFVLDAHGGTAPWERATQLSATMRVYDDFWASKRQPDLLSIETVDADIHQQRIRMTHLGDGHSVELDSTSDQVTTDKSGTVVDQLPHPRTSMAGYTGGTQWTAAQTGYFISYVTWSYLLEPFLFMLPGIETREIEPWHEVGETWRRLEVTIPKTIASHSTVQTYYFDADTGLQRRVDYSPDVNGNPFVAHYTSEHRDFDGVLVATRRRVLLHNQDGIADQMSCHILLDINSAHLVAGAVIPADGGRTAV